ncbi:peptidoglycan-recognition protein SC2-like [Oppia nitens]|uniref:peptidoglycan-recognition protein SC2-like n=1 Tax=Oppia nitens TaxID=1686743 RepID=UPI0023DCE395|nr:peptidoglycan-recognition protein SC2-like [Oppia nitens]
MGARTPKEPVKSMVEPVCHVPYIQHTYDPPKCQNQSSCIDAVKWVQDFHMDTRGWDDIGYNYLLGGDGRIYVGRVMLDLAQKRVKCAIEMGVITHDYNCTDIETKHINMWLFLFVLTLLKSYTLASICDEITWVSRAEWGARTPKEPAKPMVTPVLHAFIHHTDDPPKCQNQSSCIDAVKWVQDFHMDTRGWDDIGYNYLLGGDGRIYVGRGWYACGRHTLGMNDKAIALSLIGNYESDAPSQLILDLAQKWVKCALEKGVITHDYQLHGHRDQTCTTCPGQRLYDIIKKWHNFKGGKLDTYVCNKTLTTISPSLDIDYDIEF